MALTLKHRLAIGALALAGAALCASASAGTDDSSHPKAAAVLNAQAKAKIKARHKAAKKAEAKADVVADDEPEPDLSDTVVTHYSCELNNKVVIYTNDKDSDHIALRWKDRLHRMDRVGTTTGAQRFENPKFGLIWIGIPAKGILLDSRLNRQLANECKPAEPRPMVAAVPAEKKS